MLNAAVNPEDNSFGPRFLTCNSDDISVTCSVHRTILASSFS